ncbi:hypothetical protein BO70DRAFT_358910 [Aspergillus heteromorphus CBS 117.55]|uniref:Uncharacterized protein n=1 Tax=Aspergillus heteromorphus CBS 117.55 TaxID=1448321 RepID=A0A317WU06_9EURO|nr:uncharacterized protein BO70DRAFT_358910 [Aspergillus heteromorphus CBS 117.55]PWY89894.1 hypothetical protein BO70DRAFT_358910 [Aspergillus heteromorphus CBS 117.55]
MERLFHWDGYGLCPKVEQDYHSGKDRQRAGGRNTERITRSRRCRGKESKVITTRGTLDAGW